MTRRVEDESSMVDFLLGRLEKEQEDRLQERISSEDGLRELAADLKNTLRALDQLPEGEPSEGLTARTLARIRQDRQMKTILARQEVSRRVFKPTFSLRELAAVAAVAVAMAAVFIPSMRQARHNALVVKCGENMGQVGTAMQTFALANNGQLPAVGAPTRRWLCQTRQQAAAASNSAALFQLVQHGYALPPAFQCPAVGEGSFVAKGGMVDFPAAKFVHYSYQHALGANRLCLNDASRCGREKDMAILADATPVFDGGRFDPRQANDQAASPNHSGKGQNVLFLDWHVAWVDKPTVGVNDNNIYLVDNLYDYKGDEAPASPTDTFLLPAYSGN